MLTLEKLANSVAAYQQRRISFADFARWFEEESSTAYNSDLRDMCAAIDAAFSAYYYDQIGEAAFQEELAVAIRALSRAALASHRVVLSSSTDAEIKFEDSDSRASWRWANLLFRPLAAA